MKWTGGVRFQSFPRQPLPKRCRTWDGPLQATAIADPARELRTFYCLKCATTIIFDGITRSLSVSKLVTEKK
jgi:hypothetical protein